MNVYTYEIKCESDPRFNMSGTYKAKSIHSASVYVNGIILHLAAEYGIDESDIPEDVTHVVGHNVLAR